MWTVFDAHAIHVAPMLLFNRHFLSYLLVDQHFLPKCFHFACISLSFAVQINRLMQSIMSNQQFVYSLSKEWKKKKMKKKRKKITAPLLDKQTNGR